MSFKVGAVFVLMIANLLGCAPRSQPQKVAGSQPPEIDHVGTVYRAIKIDNDHVLLDGQYDLTISNVRTGEITSSVKTNVWAVDAIHLSDNKELWTGVPGGLAIYSLTPDLSMKKLRQIDIDKKSGLVPSVVLESRGEFFAASNLRKAVVIKADGKVHPLKIDLDGRVTSYISRPTCDYAILGTQANDTISGMIVVISKLTWKVLATMTMPHDYLITAINDTSFLLYDWAGRAIPQEIEFNGKKLVKTKTRTELGEPEAIAVSDSGKIAVSQAFVGVRVFKAAKKQFSSPHFGDSLLWIDEKSLVIVESNSNAKCLTVPE
ncbi:MAG: hypothetical protein KF836_00705 [Fimbriimonadaceae bacterium]|nr:hypothetical protein [Fimbriimonadaceae bacterium]